MVLVWFGMVWYGLLRFGAVLYNLVWFGTVWYELPQNDPWHFEICQLDLILWKWLFHVICCVQWPCQKWLFSCQNPSTGSKDIVKSMYKSADLLCTVTLPLDWLRKTTLKWPLKHWNLFNRLEIMEMSFCMSADVYSAVTRG